jgi:hypothetical protein
MDIVPGIYNTKPVGHNGFYDGQLFSNIKLRSGEVMRIVHPESERSVSKKFYEYDVLVDHMESGAFALKLYKNCLLANPMAGGGDHSAWKLRASTKSYTEVGKTDGSRVLILCIEGSNNQAIIISGLRDERTGGDDPKLGHHYDFEFNGVNFQVNDDGSCVLKQKGKTDNLGNAHRGRGEGSGTSVKIESNGNFTVATKDNDQKVVIDNTKNTITISGNKDVTIDGDKIHLGDKAGQQAVLGNELVSIMREILVGIQSITMCSLAGSPLPLTSPPINAPVFAAISARLDQILSNQTYIKRH